MEDTKNLLASRFLDRARRLGGKEAAVTGWTRQFITQYTEPQRHYHTLDHIHAMLGCLDKFRSLVKDETLMELAIFFHDWIYDPTSNDNEVESIKSFEDFARDINLSDAICSRVTHFTERTITHSLPDDISEDDPDLRLFLDFDLEVLSRPEAEYGRYAGQIRAEYGHMRCRDYYIGRINVLKAFLRRERLYFSDVFYESREKKARDNLEKEIRDLRNALDTTVPDSQP